MKTKLSTISKKIVVLGISVLVALNFTFASYAAANAQELAKKAKEVYGDSATTSEQKKEILDYLENNQDGTSVDTSQQVTITIDGNTYIYSANGNASLDVKSMIQAIYDGNHVNDGKTGSKNPEVTSKINAITDNFNVSADIDGATESLSGFLPLAKTITGLVAVATIVMSGVFASFDIVYLAFPVAKQKMDGAAQQGAMGGGSMMVNTSKHTGEAKIRFVTDDAIYAYQKATAENKQPWLIWLGRVVYKYMAIGVAVYILLTGEVAIFVNWALEATKGIIDSMADYS